MIKSELKSVDEFNASAASQRERIIFKYSPICGISYFVLAEFENWIEEYLLNEDIELYFIDVIYAKELSRHISEIYNVVHQSPQVIWIDSANRVIWNASHHSIKKDNLTKIFKSRIIDRE